MILLLKYDNRKVQNSKDVYFPILQVAICEFCTNFGQSMSKTPFFKELSFFEIDSFQFTPFIESPILLVFLSTEITLTLTLSLTESTSEGCLINLSEICEMCTSPS